MAIVLLVGTENGYSIIGRYRETIVFFFLANSITEILPEHKKQSCD